MIINPSLLTPSHVTSWRCLCRSKVSENSFLIYTVGNVTISLFLAVKYLKAMVCLQSKNLLKLLIFLFCFFFFFFFFFFCFLFPRRTSMPFPLLQTLFEKKCTRLNHHFLSVSLEDSS